MNLKMYI